MSPTGPSPQDPSDGAGAVAAQDVLAVVRGSATPEEVAALVGAIVSVRQAAAGTDAGAQEAPPASAWASREAALRRPVRAAAGAWTASAWQR